jgi:hypothetical protein
MASISQTAGCGPLATPNPMTVMQPLETRTACQGSGEGAGDGRAQGVGTATVVEIT